MKKLSAKILLVEDDPNLSLVLKDFLDMKGYKTILANNGVTGLDFFKNQNFDLCILDVMLPNKDGFTLAQDIRKLNSQVPIIFLTAKTFQEDRLKGFQMGCDDYITKPFSTEELNLRIQAILKRSLVAGLMQDNDKDLTFKFGIFEYDYGNMMLRWNDEERRLTKKEAELLKLLCQNLNKLLTREKALKLVWGDDDYFVGRSMDVFITKLRKYLKPDPNVAITNVHGMGFKLEVTE